MAAAVVVDATGAVVGGRQMMKGGVAKRFCWVLRMEVTENIGPFLPAVEKNLNHSASGNPIGWSFFLGFDSWSGSDQRAIPGLRLAGSFWW